MTPAAAIRSLTPRQQDCYRALLSLRSSRVIKPRNHVAAVADALELNVRTVRTHLAKARDKGCV